MAMTAANNKAIQKAAEARMQANSSGVTMQQYIRQMEGEIRKALPAAITPERFTRIILTALSTNPKLADTTPQSFLGAMMTAAQLGVEPNTPLGQAYLVPYYNSKIGKTECQFQIGYKGLIDLAYRSGEVTTVQAHVVYENDDFNYSLGLEPELKHVPAKSNRGDPVYVYAVFRTKGGGYGFEVLSMDDVLVHAKKYSKTFSNGPWQTNFEEMAKKTVLKRVLKYAPLKSEFARGISTDETIKTEISEDMYAVPSSYIEGEIVSSEAVEGDSENEAAEDETAAGVGYEKQEE